MSDSIADRVTEILEEATRGSDELGSLEEVEVLPEALEESGLTETAREASELIEDEDTGELLAALGLDELEDGTEPGSLLEAIAQGSEERVGDLQVLVKLAKVADVGDEELSTEVGELREAVDERVDVGGRDEESDDAADGADADDVDGADGADDEDEEESLAESAVDAVQDAVGDEEDAEDADETGFIEEELESAMRSKLEGVGDELDEARTRLDSLRGDEREEAAEAEAADDESEAEEGADADEESGRLGSESTSRSRGTMYSTMAPSPSKRADMGRSTRHSTMPDR